MSVPNTNNFTLQDVVSEIGLGATASLDDCFAAAYSTGFDPNYEGNHDRQTNFRNYTHLYFDLDVFTLYYDQYATPCSGYYVGITTNRYWYTVLDESEMDLGVYPASGYGDDTLSVYLYSQNFDTWSHSGGVMFYDDNTNDYLGAVGVIQYGIYDSCY